MDKQDPVNQVEKLLQEYSQYFSVPFAQFPPGQSICFAVTRAVFEAGHDIETLDLILKRLRVEKVKPKSYAWLLVVIKARLEDFVPDPVVYGLAIQCPMCFDSGLVIAAFNIVGIEQLIDQTELCTCPEGLAIKDRFEVVKK